jgi:hypothetical protein
LETPLETPTRAGTARVCTVTTLRAPFEETLQFVHYHLNVGLDRVILFFDDPEDPAADAVEGYERVTAVRCDRAHWAASGLPEAPVVEDRQIYNANLGLAMARAEGYGWVIHMDSDELLHVEPGAGSLGAALARVDAAAPVAMVKAVEAVPERHHHPYPFLEVRLFKVTERQIKKRLWLAKALGCRRAFYRGEYFRGYHGGKSAVRTSADVEAMGLHKPRLAGVGLDYEPPRLGGVKILHYDCCGLDAFRTKWRRRLDGTATAVKMRKNRVRQLQAFEKRLADEHQLVRLYERLYFLPPYEQRVLRALGLLTTVALDPRLFDPPPAQGGAEVPPLPHYRAAS